MEIVRGFYVISLKNNYKQKGSSTETKRQSREIILPYTQHGNSVERLRLGDLQDTL